ncbi:hypothetical protein A71_259 [Escherichia phage A7_1]|nr:hypothetical protein A71_259 [Escherichia phage A7_1]
MLQLNAKLDKEITEFWDMVVATDVDGVASPYLNNIEYHNVAAMNAEYAEEGGADKFAKSNGFTDANDMMQSVLWQAQEDFQEKTLEFARRS